MTALSIMVAVNRVVSMGSASVRRVIHCGSLVNVSVSLQPIWPTESENQVHPIDAYIVDIDECKDGSHRCSTEQSCLNTYGTYQCAERSRSYGMGCAGLLSIISF